MYKCVCVVCCVCVIALNMYVCANVLTRGLCTCLCININSVCTCVCMSVIVFVRMVTTPHHTCPHEHASMPVVLLYPYQSITSLHLREVIVYNREIFVAETGLAESSVCRQG